MIHSSWYIECVTVKLVILGHFFLPIYHPQNPKNQHCFTHVHQKSQSHDAWLLRYIMRRREFFVILHIFSPPFTPLTTWKIKILKKCKNHLEMSSFYTWTKNHNHMMYASWDMECNRQILLSFWASFCKFTPAIIQKTKILKNWPKYLEIL